MRDGGFRWTFMGPSPWSRWSLSPPPRTVSFVTELSPDQCRRRLEDPGGSGDQPLGQTRHVLLISLGVAAVGLFAPVLGDRLTRGYERDILDFLQERWSATPA